MTKVNEFPVFTVLEMEDLRRKIIHGVITEDFKAPHPAHVARASIEGKEWVKYPCWLGASKWNDGKGFFKLKFKGHTLYIHRASYECFNGPVPDGKLVDHLCRVRACRQPAHLEAITPKENILRGAQQAALIRGDAPCPISAKEINPHFFEERERADLTQEYWRRLRDGRNVRRYWEEGQLGAPPPAPEGFKWEPSGSLGPITHFLNPIRPEPHSHYDAVSAQRATEAADKYHGQKEADARHVAFVEQVMAYEPRAQVAGVDYPDTHNDPPPPPELSIKFNPAWLDGDGSAKMLVRDVHPNEVVIPPRGGPSGPVQHYKKYEFGVSVPVAPVEPDWGDPSDPHNDPFYLKMPPRRPEGWLRRKWGAFIHWLNQDVFSG